MQEIIFCATYVDIITKQKLPEAVQSTEEGAQRYHYVGIRAKNNTSNEFKAYYEHNGEPVMDDEEVVMTTPITTKKVKPFHVTYKYPNYLQVIPKQTELQAFSAFGINPRILDRACRSLCSSIVLGKGLSARVEFSDVCKSKKYPSRAYIVTSIIGKEDYDEFALVMPIIIT